MPLIGWMGRAEWGITGSRFCSVCVSVVYFAESALVQRNIYTDTRTDIYIYIYRPAGKAAYMIQIENYNTANMCVIYTHPWQPAEVPAGSSFMWMEQRKKTKWQLSQRLICENSPLPVPVYILPSQTNIFCLLRSIFMATLQKVSILEIISIWGKAAQAVPCSGCNVDLHHLHFSVTFLYLPEMIFCVSSKRKYKDYYAVASDTLNDLVEINTLFNICWRLA